MAAFSTMDALMTLCTSVPDWSKRLDELNGQIAQRQIELARLDEAQRRGREEHASPRSLRNKGSTESLRPKDGNETSLPEESCEAKADATAETHRQDPSVPATQHPTSLAATRPPRRPSTPPQAPPGAGLTRQSSQPTSLTRARQAPAALKKRKTESLASGESLAPKYRTRSMIIVYYDSAVQTAFEELVKFVSGSRNAMRKGKMAAKMAEMRRAAELEVAAEEEADENNKTAGAGPLLPGPVRAAEALVPSLPGPNIGDFTMPKLRYVSTRNMGPSRDYSRPDNVGSTLSVGLLRGYGTRGSDGSAPDIFDELDKGLEWCQSQCEHAAHQFLREGDCSQEIENIKKKLVEVKEKAELEREKQKEKEAETSPKLVRNAVLAKGKTRELKSVQMRKDFTAMKDLEVDDLTVDDEGIEDMEPAKLIFKRSKDVGIGRVL